MHFAPKISRILNCVTHKAKHMFEKTYYKLSKK